MGYVSSVRPLSMTEEAGLRDRKLIYYLEYLKPARYVPSRLKKGKPLRLALWLVIFLEPPLMEKKGECLTIHFLSLARKDISGPIFYSKERKATQPQRLMRPLSWLPTFLPGIPFPNQPEWLAFLFPINPTGIRAFPPLWTRPTVNCHIPWLNETWQIWSSADTSPKRHQNHLDEQISFNIQH